jgi:uncharacterized sporulation protein YeaH/YhbH (DUF444 family)
MMDKIIQDYERFRRIVRGKVRENLRKYISRGIMEGMQGKKSVTIPVPYIDLPRFKHGEGGSGVASGEGEEGDIIMEEEKAGNEAGDQEGEHTIEVDVTIDELVDLMAEELELPRIEDKGKKNIVEETYKYTGVAPVGPESLRHKKRTFKRALKREISMGGYDPKKPIIMPIRTDKRYRSRKTYIKPMANAVVIYMMDVSGSMGAEQKEIVRIESFLIDAWLRKNYDGIDVRYMIHDAAAREVDRDTFFHTRESGGTMISSAYRLCADMIRNDYPVSEWNIYAFHFSDGDNWSADDTDRCIEILNKELMPAVNMFGYGQVTSPYGSGQFIDNLEDLEIMFDGALIRSVIENKEGIFDSIKDFFQKGR